MNINAGDIIQDHRWPEPVEINLIENMGDYVRIVGATIHSYIHIDQLIQKKEFENLSTAIIDSNFNANPQHTFLSQEAKRYRFATLYDPLLAMNPSKVDPLPHQIEAVYGYVLKQPRIRFLIADDPGAGKTIMAGLIIKEIIQNEWFKAKRFTDDYYLYAVMNAANSPELIIRDPVENLEPEALIESVRYIVSFKKIIAKGEMDVGQ